MTQNTFKDGKSQPVGVFYCMEMHLCKIKWGKEKNIIALQSLYYCNLITENHT